MSSRFFQGFRSPLAFGRGPVPRPPAAEGCSAASRVGLPKSRPFYFDPRKKARKCQVTSGTSYDREREAVIIGECGQFGTGRERNAITHVPRGSRVRPPRYRGRPPATWAASDATDHRCIWNSADGLLRSAVVVVAGYGRSLRESGKFWPERTKKSYGSSINEVQVWDFKTSLGVNLHSFP